MGIKRNLILSGVAVGVAVVLAAAFPTGRPQAAAKQAVVAAPVVSAGSGALRGSAAGLAVDIAAVPQAPEQQSTAVRSLRPQDGLTDAQWEARLAAVRNTDWSAKGVERLFWDGPQVEPALEEGAAGLATPGAAKSFEGVANTGWTPSDMALAVNASYVLQAVNESLLVTNKLGVTQLGFPKSLQAFFGRPATVSIFDPRALYDWYKGRFIVIADEFAPGTGGTGFLNIAVSQTSSPLGLWWIYRLQMGGAGSCPDYPTIGQDRDIVYISANKFGCNNSGFTGPFQGSEVWLLPKKEMFLGQGFSFWWQAGFNVGGVQVDTLQPANVQNRSDRVRAEFMVNTFNIGFGGGQCSIGCSGLVVWAISNPRGFVTGGPAPRFTGFIVDTLGYALAPGLHQPGTSTRVASLDTRITGSVNYSAGSLFAATTTRVNTEPLTAGTIWWEVQPILNDNDPACVGLFVNKCPQIVGAVIRQQDCYLCGGWSSSGGTAFAALQPDQDNNVTMVFAYGSDTFNPGVVYVSRRVTQTLNTMHDAGICLMCGLANANTGGRWGDYYATAPDLSATAPYMWFSGMYARAGDGRWNTRIGKNGFTAINQP